MPYEFQDSTTSGLHSALWAVSLVDVKTGVTIELPFLKLDLIIFNRAGSYQVIPGA